jgi:RNA polymerase primary sigma factor
MSRSFFSKADSAPCLDLYLSEIRHDTLLSADEETSLAIAIDRGDLDARSRMIQANLRLVVKIARQFRGHGLTLDDLVGEGNLGLIRAAQDYNPAFGTRFSTYAAYWIKQSIRAALTNTTSTIRLPAHMVGLLGRWRRTERLLRRELGRDPLFTELADSLGLTPVQRQMVQSALRTRFLVREGHRELDRDASWCCEETSDPRDSHEDQYAAEEERRNLHRRLDQLEPRERKVICLRFGLEGNRVHTLQEVGRQLGVTREWVRKIELRAVRKLDDRRMPWKPSAERRQGSRASTQRRRKQLAQIA